MKNLIYLAALAFALTLAACSNTEQDVLSPVDSQIEKSMAGDQRFPYEIYQAFDELTSAKISWRNYKNGLNISVSEVTTIMEKHFFAVIEFTNSKGTTMSFLGSSKTGNYFLNGFNVKEISGIRIFEYAVSSIGGFDIPLPYPVSQLFGSHSVKDWLDGGAEIKVNSNIFPSNMNQLFGLLIAKEGNQLIFLGIPESESFGFPKTNLFNVVDLKLFTYQK